MKYMVTLNGKQYADDLGRTMSFDKFYQADTSHTMEGNGIGLAIVKRILTLCGGSIEVDSRPGEGTAVTVCLPEA